jgi:hypothetical protein
MNSRQKAKHFKKKFLELLKQPVKYRVETYHIDTLETRRMYPQEFAMQNKEYIEKALVTDLAYEISEHLEKYADYKCTYSPLTNMYEFRTRIRVVQNR